AGGTFVMKNGEISGNNVVSNGGGVLVYGGGSFAMSGGTVTRNVSESSGGSGVYVDNGTFSVSGKVNVTGNLKGGENGTAANVVLYQNMSEFFVPGYQPPVIAVTGKLDENTRIGVGVFYYSGVFTDGLNGRGSIANFTCDDSRFEIAETEAHELKTAAKEYKIDYDLDGGTNAKENPVTYTSEYSDFTLAEPTRENYVFTGWTGTGLDGQTKTVTIRFGSSGDRSYTAHWEKLPAAVTITGVSDDGKTVGCKATNAPAGTMLIVASYQDGKLAAVETYDLGNAENTTVDVTLGSGGTSYKLMLVNKSDFAPRCAADTWPKQS
ncbi:MAG: InlB B-repeat-containing protein, partial [Oscillospiraceae bacterium]|nr:InlB B-repeat-containing protein [Oscillospiraceae bacterium]